MARKNPFADLVDDQTAPATLVEYHARGASRSILSSIGEIADRASRLVEGDTVVELDTALIDPSFLKDRLEGDDADFMELVEAIRERGQDTPILVRPHPSKPGRYMVVFGHRRLRAAAQLGRKVRGVVKEMAERDHVIAQGQENSARASLSFIERALFAANLTRLEYNDDNATVMTALSVDRATLSKMLSVTSLPADILRAVGPAKGIGRDRWYELKILLDNPASHAAARAGIEAETFHALPSDGRFHAVVAAIKAARTARREPQVSRSRSWSPADGALSADISTEGKRFTLALKARGKDAQAFGSYLSDRLDDLYETFRQETITQREGG